jgi:peptidoglycan hydrolase CwlO-like protein
MRRKNRAEAQHSELDNIDKAISIWRSLAQDLEKKISQLESEIEFLKDGQVKKCENCKYRKYYNENHRG